MPNTGITPELYREAWSKFVTGVTAITTLDSDGTGVHGMTANGVASISLDPPLGMVAIGHNRDTLPLVLVNQRFGISVLTQEQRGIARYFSVPEEIRKTLPIPPYEDLGESKVVEGALSAMDCRVTRTVQAGDHTIFLVEIEQVKVGFGHPLLFYQSQFAEIK